MTSTNTPANSYGIRVGIANNNTVQNCTCTVSGGTGGTGGGGDNAWGVWVSGSSGTMVQGCTCNVSGGIGGSTSGAGGSAYGILVDTCPNTAVQNCFCQVAGGAGGAPSGGAGLGYGIYATNSTNSTVKSNTILSPSDYGIYLVGTSAGNKITDNIINGATATGATGSNYCIQTTAAGAAVNTFERNTVSKCNTGLAAPAGDNGAYNIFVQNTASYNNAQIQGGIPNFVSWNSLTGSPSNNITVP